MSKMSQATSSVNVTNDLSNFWREPYPKGKVEWSRPAEARRDASPP